MNIHIAKVNEIEVLQTGTSSLSVDNKKDNKADVKKGVNKQVDLGLGVKTLTVTLNTLDSESFNELYKVLALERKCKLTDKFLGSMKASVDNFKIEHTDSNIGISIFNITFIVEESFIPNVNYTGHLRRIQDRIKKNLSPQYIAPPNERVQRDFREKVEVIVREVNNINRGDYNRKLFVNTGFSDYINSLDTKNTDRFFEQRNLHIFKGIRLLSQGFGRVKYTRSYNLNQNILSANLAFTLFEISSILETDSFKMQERVVAQCVERLKLCSVIHTELPLIEWSETLVKFINGSELPKYKTITIERERTLLNIVYGLYGSLDNFDKIYALNAITDANKVTGEITILL